MSRIIVVDANSASPPLPGVTYYGIEATHSNMCKFDSACAPGFRTVTTDLRAWSQEAPSLIAARWRVEDEEHVARIRQDITERMSPYLCPTLGGQLSPVRPLTPIPPLEPGLSAPSSTSHSGMFLKTPQIFELCSAPSSHQVNSADSKEDQWSQWSASVFEVEREI